uniref:C3H1-type domain-containing protein n=1 Tax=Cacopsylla melanoneura TaxID=428564 RepID=A0A8D8Q405_9HEMI
MIPSKEFITEINGKKLCWMYKKGRCRFGSNCKYAHDSELYNQDKPKSEDSSVDPNSHHSNAQSQPPPPLHPRPPGVSYFPPHQPTSDFHQPLQGGFPSEGNDDSKPFLKKKRPGLSQNIVPGKKVMKMYYSSGKQGT